jgi:hypothetical protein
LNFEVARTRRIENDFIGFHSRLGSSGLMRAYPVNAVTYYM